MLVSQATLLYRLQTLDLTIAKRKARQVEIAAVLSTVSRMAAFSRLAGLNALVASRRGGMHRVALLFQHPL